MRIMRRVPEKTDVLCKMHKKQGVMGRKFSVILERKSLQFALLCGKITVGGCNGRKAMKSEVAQ